MEKNQTNLIILQEPYVKEYEDCMGVISTANLLIGKKLKDGSVQIILEPYIEPIEFHGPGTYSLKIHENANSKDYIEYDIKINHTIDDYHDILNKDDIGEIL